MQSTLRHLTLAVVAIAATLLTSSAVWAQGRGGDPNWPPSGPIPRTADGHPDLTGNWQPNAIRQNVDMIGAGVEVPMLPEARVIYDKRKAALGREDPEARCLPPGVPRMSTTPYPWSFVQTPKEIVIVYEGGAHVWRKIFMDGRSHDPKVEQTWLGDSIGHWEGDSLVVETVGQNDITWIDAAGIPHSTDMKVVERISAKAHGGLLLYEILNLVDGKRTVQGIRDYLAAAYGSVSTDDVTGYLHVLEKIGVIRLEG